MGSKLALAAILGIVGTIAATASGIDPPCEPDWIGAFGDAPGTNGEVLAATYFADPELGGPATFVGGGFTRAGGVSANHVARWDGERWMALGAGTDGPIRALAVFDDGSGPALYVGGDFTLAGDVPAANLAKWDGKVWSAVGNGVNGTVRALLGKSEVRGAQDGLYVGGDFSMAGVCVAAHVARWDGREWTAIGSGTDAPVHMLVEFAAEDDFPSVVAGGEFLSAGGGLAPHVARWDGARWSSLAGGLDACVRCADVFDDGRARELCVGGDFTIADGRIVVGHVARWNGTRWSPMRAGLNDSVAALRACTDSSGAPILVAGGAFLFASGSFAPFIAKWDGALWSPLPGGPGVDAPVAALAAVDADDRAPPELYVGGSFGAAGSTPAAHIARWDGSSYSVVGGGLDSTVRATASIDLADGGTALYVGGDFALAGGEAVEHIAQWNGATWQAVGGGTSGSVTTLAAFDEALYVGGAFTSAGGVPMSRIGRWDGTSWTALGVGVNGAVHAMTVFDEGSGLALYVAGSFSMAGGASAHHIAKWDGKTWSPLGDGLGPDFATVYALKSCHDERGKPVLAVGGTFTSAGGKPAAYFAFWDGADWSTAGAGMDGPVMAIETFDAGSGDVLVAGGYFTSADGADANHIAQWDGSTWSPLAEGVESTSDGDAPIRAIVSVPTNGESNLYVGGLFTHAGGVPASNIARWDGRAWSALGVGLPDYVRALAVESGPASEPSLVVGGKFITSAAGDSFLARWQLCPATCAGDLDASGAVDASDLAVLLGAWGTGAADLDGDGDTGAADLAILLGGWGACR